MYRHLYNWNIVACDVSNQSHSLVTSWLYQIISKYGLNVCFGHWMLINASLGHIKYIRDVETLIQNNVTNRWSRLGRCKEPTNTVKVNIFAWDNFRVFWDIAFFAKISKCENETHMTLSKRKEYYCENYPDVKCLANIFSKCSPNKNNHVYSIVKIQIFIQTHEPQN